MDKIRLFYYMAIRRVITFKRLINFISVSVSYLFRMKKVRAIPPALMVEPTDYCNLKCPLCPTGNNTLNRSKGFMDLEIFRSMIDEIGDSVIHLTMWGYGEPLMNRDFSQMVAYAKKKNIYVRTSTNGSFFKTDDSVDRLIDSGLDELIVSLDGATQETLDQYMVGAKLEEILEGLERLRQRKAEKKAKYPITVLQFLVMRHNEHEIPRMKEISREYGVDRLALKTIRDTPAPQSKVKNKRYRRLVKIKNICSRVWFSSVVNWDGGIIPCCHDLHAHFVMGQLDSGKSETFTSVWNNEKYRKFRAQIIRDKNSISICRNCHGSFQSLEAH
ncbi:radical SAM protein [bacterium]|nr:radical SAM protein [bacterium]